MNHQDLFNSGRLLPVMEEFYSLQGEGFHTGEAAWFIRIGGCDVGCTWCDVKESWNARLFPPVDTDKVAEKALQCTANAVIITGGEPLLYNLDYLCEQLKAKSSGQRAQDTERRVLDIEMRIADPASRIANHLKIENRTSKIIRTFLETSGSRPLSGFWDWICLSPKRDWPPREEFYRLSNELKIIIHAVEDFDWAEEQAGKINPSAHMFLQPEWSRREEILPLIIRYIQDHPWWRLSLQSHKYIGIP